jgi:F-type H+-transporting ATPase subunit delta
MPRLAAQVKSALAAATSSQGQGDDYDAAANRAALELYGALDSALDSKA